MIDKKLENNIKKTKEFIEIWSKFSNIFKRALSEGHVGNQREKEFMSTKYLVDSRYDDLMDSLGVKPLKRFTMGPAIYNVLSIDKLSIMSDDKIKKFEEDLSESNKFLEALLSRLDRKKRRIESFNKFYLSLRRKFRKERA